jgi:hypothetical protein
MALQVVDARNRPAQGSAQGAREGGADQQGAEQAGTAGERDLIDRFQGNPGLSEGGTDDVIDFLKVGPGGDFGYHAPVSGMVGDLAVQLVRQNPHSGIHDAARSFVARGFNPEGYHGRKITYAAGAPKSLPKTPE